MVGRQTPLLALFVPLVLVGMVDGVRGLRQAWPAAIVGGFVFAVAQFACSNYISVELTDIVASLLAIGALVALLRVWQPSEPVRGRAAAQRGPRSPAPPCPTRRTRPRSGARRTTTTATAGREVAEAYAPVPHHHRRLRHRPVRPDQGPRSTP